MKTAEDLRIPQAERPSPPSPTQPSRSKRGVMVAIVIALIAVTIAMVAATRSSSAPRASVKADLAEWSVTLDHASLSPGKYNFAIANGGKVDHELIAFRTTVAADALPKDAEGRINEDDAALTSVTDGPDIAIGKSTSRTVDLSKAGTYVFMCNLPTHYGLGMHTVVTVA